MIWVKNDFHQAYKWFPSPFWKCVIKVFLLRSHYVYEINIDHHFNIFAYCNDVQMPEAYRQVLRYTIHKGTVSQAANQKACKYKKYA